MIIRLKAIATELTHIKMLLTVSKKMSDEWINPATRTAISGFIRQSRKP